MGTSEVAKSPLSPEDCEDPKKSALFSEADVLYLRLCLDMLEDQIDDLLKSWRGINFDHPHLRAMTRIPIPARSIPRIPTRSANASGSG